MICMVFDCKEIKCDIFFTWFYFYAMMLSCVYNKLYTLNDFIGSKIKMSC